MDRMMRRAPWIALGAAGAFYLDPAAGAARRRDLAGRVRDVVGRLRGDADGAGNRYDHYDMGPAFDSTTDGPTELFFADEVLVEVVTAPGGEWTADGYGGESGGA